MPQTSFRRLRTGLIMLPLLLCLTACLPESSPAPTPKPPESVPIAETDTSAEALRTYYESLILDLKQALLDEKQADYITRRDYETRIAELESKLAALQNGDGPSPAVTDIPVSGDPSPLPPPQTETAAPNPPSASFHFAAEGGGITITSYSGTAREVTVPDTITGLPVTRIGDNAFQSSHVTSVTLPDTVTEIGWFAFAGCTSLGSVTIPASVTSIEYGAFEGCADPVIRCPRGSYAEAYAKSFGIRVVHTHAP